MPLDLVSILVYIFVFLFTKKFFLSYLWKQVLSHKYSLRQNLYFQGLASIDAISALLDATQWKAEVFKIIIIKADEEGVLQDHEGRAYDSKCQLI